MDAAPSSRFVRKLLHGKPPDSAPAPVVHESAGSSKNAPSPDAGITGALALRLPSPPTSPTGRRSDVAAQLPTLAPETKSGNVATSTPSTFEVGYDELPAGELDRAIGHQDHDHPCEDRTPSADGNLPARIVQEKTEPLPSPNALAKLASIAAPRPTVMKRSRLVVAAPKPVGVDGAEPARIRTDRIRAPERRRSAFEERIGGSRPAEDRLSWPSALGSSRSLHHFAECEPKRSSNPNDSHRSTRAPDAMASITMRPTVRIDRDPDEDSAYDAVLLRIRSALAAKGSAEAPANTSVVWPFASLAVGVCTEGIDVTSVAVGLALRLAHHSERRVCVVDADASGRRLTARAGLSGHAGLGDLLAGNLEEDPFIPVANANVSILPAGGVTDSARATSADFDKVVERLESRFDHVLYDVGSFRESSALRWSRRIGNAVLVLGVGRTVREEISRTVASLRVTGVRFLGAVLQRQDEARRSRETRGGSAKI